MVKTAFHFGVLAIPCLWLAIPATVCAVPDDPFAPLAEGTLEVWVPDTFVTGTMGSPMVGVTRQFQWSPLLAEFKADFPAFDLRLKVMERSQFVRAIHSAEASSSPDIVFVDNQSERGPLLDSNAAIQMLEPARFNQNGWWLAFRQSKNFTAAQAFLIWLSQSPHWQPWHVVTSSLHDSDAATVRSIATQALTYYLQADARSLASFMDPQASQFYRLAACENVGSAQALLTFGNARMAFVLASALCQREKAYGLSHSALVLRKVEDRWKVLLFVDGALPSLEAALKRFDRMRLQDGPQQALPPIKVLGPEDHARIARFPRGELEWEVPAGSPPLTYLVESQFANPGLQNWAPSRTEWILPPIKGPVASAQIPFGAGMQPHRWRLWAISSTGDLSMSDWRTVDFTN